MRGDLDQMWEGLCSLQLCTVMGAGLTIMMVARKEPATASLPVTPRSESEVDNHGEEGARDKSAYRFMFGWHRGKTLDEVPRSYIDWLIGEGVPKRRPHLKRAIAEMARGWAGGDD